MPPKEKMPIKSELHLNSVLSLMRKAQKEAKRFPSKANVATAKYWEDIIDRTLLSGVNWKARTLEDVLAAEKVGAR